MVCTAFTNCVFSIGPALQAFGVIHPLDGEQLSGVGVGQHIHMVEPLLSSCCRPYGYPQFSLLQGDMQPSMVPLLMIRKSTDFSDTVLPMTVAFWYWPLYVRSSPLGHLVTSSVEASTPLKPQLEPTKSHPDTSPRGDSLYGMVQPSTWLVSNQVVGF